MLIKGFILSVCLTVCLAAGDALRFIIIGDNGGTDNYPYITNIENGTSQRMARVAESVGGIDFVLELGDNFYENGVKSVDDPRFVETFEKGYKAKSLQVPFFMVAGNHDHRGNVSAEIMYTKRSTRWRFHDFYYKLTFEVPNSDATLDILMIDTVLLTGMTDDHTVLQPQGPEDPALAEQQWAWIEQQLESSTATYLFTAGHYPVYSVAEHGPTPELVNRLLPMLYKYKANGHLCGHDHNLQYLQETKDEVTLDFILSGCADKMDESTAHKHSNPSGVPHFHWADKHVNGGLVYVDMMKDKMVSSFISADGNFLYSTTSYPRKL